MERYKISVLLNAIPGARILNVNMGNDNIQKCVVIPLNDSMSQNEKGEVSLELVAYPNKKKGKFNQTHSIKMRLSAEKYKSMTKEQLYSVPFMGAMYTFTPQPVFNPVPTHNVETQQYVQAKTYTEDNSFNVSSDDLPF